MASKYCSSCTQKRLLSSFLSDTSNLGSKVLATCNICRAYKTRYNKRKALQPLDPNVLAKRRPTKAPTRPTPSILHLNPFESCLAATIPPNPTESHLAATIPPNPPESRPEATIPPPNPPELRPEPTTHPNPPES